MTTAYKDIVVHLDADEACAARIELAADLAARFDAHLTGVGVERNPHLSILDPVPTPKFLEDKLKAQDAERLRTLRKRFDDTVGHTAVKAEWRTSAGPIERALETQARYADLVVVGQNRFDERPEFGADPIDTLVLSAGVPVLVVPYIGVQRPVGKHMLVAWNGGREAIRAVHDALPLLQQADAVEVVSIESKGHQTTARVPGADIALHLSRLGVATEAKVLATNGIDAPNLLLSYAADADADSIVMGAYGHSRFRELVLGGVTREVMHSMTVPILMSH